MMDAISGFFLGLAALFMPGLAADDGFSGYVEADYLYVAPQSGGRITAIPVTEGEAVEIGALLFSLDHESQDAAYRAAEARRAVAEANLDNLKTGSRAPELEVTRANLRQAEADLALARSTLERDMRLMESGFASEAQIDADRTRLATAEAQIAQLKAQLEVAELPARDAQLVAAQKSLEAAEADSEQARTALGMRDVTAPAAAIVDRLYFRAGEVVATGTPVLSLLPPGALKVRFFVPEPARTQLRVGETMSVTCDGCPEPLRAELTYLASEAQHTPPIIYSRDERARLVFMAEARLEARTGLLPGQPVSVSVAE